MSTQQIEKGNKKIMNGWAFYDWANSVYNLVISSGRHSDVSRNPETLTLLKKDTGCRVKHGRRIV